MFLLRVLFKLQSAPKSLFPHWLKSSGELVKISESTQYTFLVVCRAVWPVRKRLAIHVCQVSSKTLHNGFRCTSVPFLSSRGWEDISISSALQQNNDFVTSSSHTHDLVRFDEFNSLLNFRSSVSSSSSNDNTSIISFFDFNTMNSQTTKHSINQSSLARIRFAIHKRHVHDSTNSKSFVSDSNQRHHSFQISKSKLLGSI
mmetsp:Transcript_8394/g.11580  ORF Transcript_8394/g.11580 Transcript_8394/m.11580 type:complete len:201 (-) Transcript_8394:386-988(-)